MSALLNACVNKKYPVSHSTNHVVVGGTRQQGDGDLAYRPEETQRFLEKACQMMPSLRVRQTRAVA